MDKDKKRFSVYKITINTNVDYNKITDEQKSSFKKIAKYVFSNHIKKYIIFKKEGPILKIKTDYRFEVSSKRLVHLHGIIHLTHKADIRLDYKIIKELLIKAFGSNMYMMFYVDTDKEKAWEEYMKKGDNSKMKVIDL